MAKPVIIPKLLSREDGAELMEPHEWLTPKPKTGRPINIQEYVRDLPENPPWIIDNVLLRGGVTLLSATPKTGKSTLTMQMMRALENPGRDVFLGQASNGGVALYLTEEGGYTVRRKAYGLTTMDVYDRTLAAGEKFEMTLAKVTEWVNAQKHINKVVVIDTLAAWAEIAEENSSTEVTNSMKAILALAQKTQCCVILVHHMRKSGGTHGEGIRGSGALYASVEHSLEMRRHHGAAVDDPRRIIDITSRAMDGEVWYLNYDRLTQTYTKDDNPEQAADDKMQAWLDLLPAEDEEGFTLVEVAAAWGLDNTSTADRKLKAYIAHLPPKVKVNKRGKANIYWRASEE